MKRFIFNLILAMVVLLSMSGACFAINGDMASASSGEQTASASVYGGSCYLTAFEGYADGSNVATLLLYDGSLTTGKVIRRIVIPASTYRTPITFPFPILCEDGVSVSVVGTGASCVVDFVPK